MHFKDGRTLKFTRTPQGLYSYRPTDHFRQEVAKAKQAETTEDRSGAATTEEACHVVSTLVENKRWYTAKQVEAAKLPRRLYHIVGCPSVENFNSIIKQQIIKNCPVTTEDITVAERIYGPDIGMLKVKSTR